MAGSLPFRCAADVRDGGCHGASAELERLLLAVVPALLEVLRPRGHRVRDVREARHRPAKGTRHGEERRGLHLDGQDPLGSPRRDERGALPERGVRRPGCATDERGRRAGERPRHRVGQRGVRVREPRRREVVIARPFVAERALDEHEERRAGFGRDEAGRGDRHERLAAGGEQLLGDEHRERCSDGASDDADLRPAGLPPIQLRVEAGPGGSELRASGGDESLDQLAVHVEQAAGRDPVRGQPLLAPGAVEEVTGLEHGSLGGVVIDDGCALHDPSRYHPLATVASHPMAGSGAVQKTMTLSAATVSLAELVERAGAQLNHSIE